MDTIKKAFLEIASLPHDDNCNTQVAGCERRGCSCHVDIAEQALLRASRSTEHVAVVRPDEPGTVHFEPPLVREGGAIVRRMDVRNNADGTIGIGIVTITPVRQDGEPHPDPVGILVPPKTDPRAVDPALVDAYRKADANVRLAQKWGAGTLPGRPAPVGTLHELFRARELVAVALASDVVARADAIVTAGASLLEHLRTLVRSASYTLGNPMSGLGGNTTAQAALESLREAEVLLDQEGAG
jgi:hypothetical protein